MIFIAQMAKIFHEWWNEQPRTMTTNRLAEEVGVCPQTVRKWINGRAVPKGAAAQVLMLKYGVHPLEWTTGDAE